MLFDLADLRAQLAQLPPDLIRKRTLAWDGLRDLNIYLCIQQQLVHDAQVVACGTGLQQSSGLADVLLQRSPGAGEFGRGHCRSLHSVADAVVNRDRLIAWKRLKP